MDFSNFNYEDIDNANIYEKDGKYHIEMDVPGYKKEDIKIEELDEEEYLDIFLDKYEKMFGKKDNTIYLKERVPYEDIAEKRYMVEDPIERNVISSLFTEASSFESLMALGTTSIFDDVMKIIKA